MTSPALEAGPASLAAGPAPGALEVARIALGTPAAWPLALAGFLVRGGILLFVLPVVVLPTPTGLATLLGPLITLVALASPTTGIFLGAGAAALLAIAWVAVASAIGAATDAILARWGAARLRGHASARPGADDPPRPAEIVRIAAVRIACHLPTIVAAAWAGARIVEAVYREYISPGDLSVPLPLRVIAAVPDALALLAVVWLLGEAFGGLAARGIALEGRTAGGAIRAALASVALHPASAVVSLVAGTFVVVALVAPALATAALAWSGAARQLLDPRDPAVVLASSLAFVGSWLAALALAGAAVTWRSVIWTRHVVAAGSGPEPR